jgi:uncharacterized protein (DUF1501 family)
MEMKMANKQNRRTMLRFLGTSGAAWYMKDILPGISTAQAAGESGPYEGNFLVFCTFDGGWDQLLACDPRSAAEFDSTTPINPAYEVIKASDTGPGGIQDVVDNVTGGTGVYTPPGSNIEVGPAMYALAKEHWEDLCIVRGLDMGTLTHAVGKRYLLTGKFPRGLQANGSSLTSAAVAELSAGTDNGHTPLPNLVVGMESYSEDLPAWASGMVLSAPSDLILVLKAISEPIGGEAGVKVDDFVNTWTCLDYKLDGQETVTTFRSSADKAKDLTSGEFYEFFNFIDPSPETKSTLEAFGITANGAQALNQLALAGGQAFMAAQCITQSVAQCISVRLATGIDHHDDDWESDHGPAIREGLDALSLLITHLKNTLDHNNKPFWDRTTVVVSSEFARTPNINSRGGRDHHLSSSCIVAGNGIKGNQIIGGTDDAGFLRQAIDPETGAVGGDVFIRPSDVHATVMKAMGLSYEHLSNQDPVIINAMLKDA